MKNILFAIALIATCAVCDAQNCNIAISGQVLDSMLGTALPGSTIHIKEVNVNAIAGRNGEFKMDNLCAGKYTIVITHVNYDTLSAVINTDSSLEYNFLLQPHSISLTKVVVTGAPEKKDQITTLSNTDIKGVQLFETRGLTLGESLKSVTGLNSLQTGPSLSKPVIHGLHSNRYDPE